MIIPYLAIAAALAVLWFIAFLRDEGMDANHKLMLERYRGMVPPWWRRHPVISALMVALSLYTLFFL